MGNHGRPPTKNAQTYSRSTHETAEANTCFEYNLLLYFILEAQKPTKRKLRQKPHSNNRSDSKDNAHAKLNESPFDVAYLPATQLEQ